MPDGGRRVGAFQTILVVACAALAALVLALAWQNRGLKAELAQARQVAAQHAVPADALKDGDRCEPLDLVDAASRATMKLAFDGTEGTTLLLVFSSTCPACADALPIWNEIAANLPAGVRVAAIQSDLAAAPPVAGARFPIHGFAGARPDAMRRIPYVPCTAVIAADGTIVSVVFGVPTEEQRTRLIAALAS